MIEAVIIALIIAKVKGYNLKAFFKSWTIYPILIFEVMYVLFQVNIFMGNYEVVKWAPYFKSIYMYLFLIPIFWYKEYLSAIIGALFIFLGTFLNKLVIIANGGKMPAFPSLTYLTGYLKEDTFSKIQDIHALGNSTVNLKYLSDIFDIGYSILSVGDIFIRVFVVLIIYATVKKTNEEIKLKTKEA